MAITITQESKAAWDKAIAKARQIKPRVTILGHGQFKVCGSKGDCYNVTWTGHKGAELKATCDCKAGQANRPCYHIPPTAGMFKLQVRERAEKTRPTCTECSHPAIEDTNLCEFHLELRELSKAFSTPDLPQESTLVECRECGNFYPESSMTGAGYAPICSDCLLFGGN